MFGNSRVVFGAWLVWGCLASFSQADEIHDAVKTGNLARVSELIQASPSLVGQKSPNGWTPIHVAAAANRADMIELLLDKGADIESRAAGDWTPLHAAAYQDASSAVLALLAKGANAGARTQDAHTPIELAFSREATNTVRVLLEKTVVPAAAPAGGDIFGSLTSAPVPEIERAVALLGGLLRETPDSERINMAYGLMCAALGEQGKAQLAFERVLLANPDNTRARFEYGRCWIALGQAAPAREAFQAVLARSPPPDVELLVRGYLESLNRMATQWRLSLRPDAGWLYDDNANVGPDSQTIRIAPVLFGSDEIRTLTVGESSRPVKASGPYAALTASAIHDVGLPQEWVMTYDGSWYQNWLDEEAYRGLIYQASAGAQHARQDSLLQAGFRYTHVGLGSSPLVNIYGFHPLYATLSSLTRDLTWTTQAACDWRDYSSLDARDGLYVSAGETARYRRRGLVRSVSAGLTVFHDFADDGVYENTAASGEVGADAEFLDQFDLCLRLRYTAAVYREREPLAPRNRRDSQWMFLAGVGRKITSNSGISLQFQTTDANSTYDLYEYVRHVITLGVWMTF